MCNPMLAMLAVTAVSTAVTYDNSQKQANYQEDVGKYNEVMNGYAAQDATNRANQQTIDVQRKAAQARGAQVSRAAVAGLDLGTGTVAANIDQTDFFGQMDADTARLNGAKEAWAARSAGKLARFQGDASAANTRAQANATLLSEASQVAGKWYMMSGTSPSLSGQKDPGFSGGQKPAPIVDLSTRR